MPTRRDELDEMVDAFSRLIARSWPSAVSAPSVDLLGPWSDAATHGWTAVVDDDDLDVLVQLQVALGRLACPLPLIDGVLAVRAAGAVGAGPVGAVGAGPVGAVGAGLVEAIGAGRVRPTAAVARIDDGGRAVARHVEAAPLATHLLALDPDRRLLGWYGLDDARIVPVAGTPIPAWSQVETGARPEWTAPYEPSGDLARLAAVGLAARALGAVARSHELAVAHAVDRQQFGHPIGHFQAVSHRLVNAELELEVGRRLLDLAVAARRGDPDGWAVGAALFLEHVGAQVPLLQYAAHHTLAAVGYFEEHEAPWLYRRAHADIARARHLAAGLPSAGGMILDRGARPPHTDLGPEAEQLRREVVDAFAPWSGPPSHLGRWDDGARETIRDRGWIGVGWPREVGGAGLETTELLAFSEALGYADPPLGNILMGINSVAPMVIRYGGTALRDRLLDELRTGSVTIALGYSESEAGSDLASLRTTARAVEGGWLVSGSKMWGTCWPDSDYVLLAARTDPQAARHAGITLFLVDTDSPGISSVDHRSLAGELSSTTYWDDVFVPADRVVGEVNRGWQALGAALASERVLIGASVMRVQRSLDRLLELLRERASLLDGPGREEVRRHVGRLTARVTAARAIVVAGVAAAGDGTAGLREAPMAKVIATELAEDFNTTAIALLGPDSLAGEGSPGALADGLYELGARTAIMGVVSGGTNDIQRNLIARGMGLPR